MGKKFYEKKTWSCALCAALMICVIVIAMFVVVPLMSPPDSIMGDFDGDGIPNIIDDDDDGDGIPDATDPNPYDPDIGDDGGTNTTSYVFIFTYEVTWYDGASGIDWGNPGMVTASEDYYYEGIEVYETGPDRIPPYSWSLAIFKHDDGRRLEMSDPFWGYSDPDELNRYYGGSWGHEYGVGSFDQGTWNDGDPEVVLTISVDCTGFGGHYINTLFSVYNSDFCATYYISVFVPVGGW